MAEEILKQESLMRLISMSNSMKGKDDEKDVIYLRSSLDDNLFYEIRKKQTDLYMFVCTRIRENVNIPKRLFCCYVNGDIIYDGFWLFELEESLPLMYNRLVKAYHKTKIANNEYEDLQLEYIDPIEINELNNRFLRARMFSRDQLKKYFNLVRFRY